ncbi:MAG: DMT family protein [Tahibacter sp.]
MSAYLTPILLLIASNVFMTFAWYGHLKYTDRPVVLVILVSWGIAFFEYCLQVPANRSGYLVYNPAQLKTIQEIVTLVVFVAFSIFYLDAPIKWNHLVGFGLIVAAGFFIFMD